MTYSSISTSVHGGVGVIEMTSGATGNLLTPEGSELELQQALQDFQNATAVRAVVLTGSGQSFSLGNVPNSDPQAHAGRSLGQRYALGYSQGIFWYWLPEFRKPLVAAVNGSCADGGWELALMCDLVVSARSATFHMNQLDMGVNPCHTMCHFLTRSLGKHRAMDLILNTRNLTAQQCLEWGLVNVVTDDDECLARAISIADQLAARPPLTVAVTKRLTASSGSSPAVHDLERAVAFFLRTTDDTKTAVAHWPEPAPASSYHDR